MAACKPDDRLGALAVLRNAAMLQMIQLSASGIVQGDTWQMHALSF